MQCIVNLGLVFHHTRAVAEAPLKIKKVGVVGRMWSNENSILNWHSLYYFVLRVIIKKRNKLIVIDLYDANTDHIITLSQSGPSSIFLKRTHDANGLTILFYNRFEELFLFSSGPLGLRGV